MHTQSNKKRKPYIAISSRIKVADTFQWLSVPQAYFEAILMAGGIPIMVYLHDEADIKDIINTFDALLIPGGEDIHPSFYNQNKEHKTVTSLIEIDELDIKLIHAFSEKKKPILGICRGMQVLNIAFQGTLFQDIATSFHTISPKHHEQRLQVPIRSFENTTCHEIVTLPNSMLQSIFGEVYKVNSFHHQCIHKLAEGFLVSATSKVDGIIEGIEKDSVIGVQWHPEWLMNDGKSIALFKWLIKAAMQ